MTKQAQNNVLEKAGFKPGYRLMQTSLDQPEIMQIHQFIKNTKASCLDLQFILSKTANKARNIQKTIIFVNCDSEICLLINIIVGWMKKLGYPDYCTTWIRPYHSTMSDWDKDLIANAFLMPGDKNIDYVILVVTDAYQVGLSHHF